MRLTEHVLLGAGATAALVPVMGVEAAGVFWASSVLLDVDHYLEYVHRTRGRDWSPVRMFAFHAEVFRRLHRPELLALSVFHTLEWFALVFVAWYWWDGPVGLAVFLGMVFHLGCDLLRLETLGAITKRAVSLVEYAIRRRRLVRQGFDPDGVQKEALIAIGAMPAARMAVPAAGTAPSFTVIVPALNEAENLRAAVDAVLKEVGRITDDLEVLVYDDASTDETGAIADELAAQDSRVVAIHNERRLNIGGIYKAGVARARGDYVFLVPGDNETRVDETVRGFTHHGPADLMVFFVTNPGVRSVPRRALSGLYVLAVNTLFGTAFRYTNATNVFRTEVVRRLVIRTNGFSYQTEAVVKAVRSGVDFVQVGVELQRRVGGTSKAVTWKNLRNVAASLARLWWDVAVTDRARYRQRGQALGVF